MQELQHLPHDLQDLDSSQASMSRPPTFFPSTDGEGSLIITLVNLIIVSAQFGCWPDAWRVYVSCFFSNVSFFGLRLMFFVKRKRLKRLRLEFLAKRKPFWLTFDVFRQT